MLFAVSLTSFCDYYECLLVNIIMLMLKRKGIQYNTAENIRII